MDTNHTTTYSAGHVPSMEPWVSGNSLLSPPSSVRHYHASGQETDGNWHCQPHKLPRTPNLGEQMQEKDPLRPHFFFAASSAILASASAASVSSRCFKKMAYSSALRLAVETEQRICPWLLSNGQRGPHVKLAYFCMRHLQLSPPPNCPPPFLPFERP